MLRLISYSILFYFLVPFVYTGHAQINNLVHPEGYQAALYGSLGKVEKFGNGPKDMLMIAGWGFGGNIFENFKADSLGSKYTMYVVTLPGFGGTQAYPMPDQNDVYHDLYWTAGIISGIKELLEKEEIDNPVLLSYFTYSNILAMRIALDYPELIDRVIIISGMAKFTTMYPSFEPASLEERIYYTEKVIAQNWWKEIDKQGWDNGNFSAETFTKDSVKAAQYWKQMSNIPIPIMVRYLLEYYCTDLSLEYKNLQVPTLVIMPSFNREILIKPKNTFLSHSFHQSWWGANPSNPNFHLMTITDSRAFILDDRPKELIDAVNLFVMEKLSPYDIQR
ncbi:MAG: alpha/beta fold hydrolase [Flavobacteriaceae bacterium]